MNFRIKIDSIINFILGFTIIKNRIFEKYNFISEYTYKISIKLNLDI